MTKNTSIATVHTLDDCRPTVKNLMLFIVMMRRGIRRTVAVLDSQRDKARHYRRQARLLKERANAFDAARIAALETMADEATAECKPFRESLKQCGDLTEADGLHRIVFAHGLEDSAARLRDDWKNGPFFQASNQVYMDFLLHSKEGQKIGNSLFEPGGLFADVPTYSQQPDGTMKRLPPRLHVAPTGEPASAHSAA